MLKKIGLVLLGLSSFLCISSASATDLMDVYRQALSCDPTYQNAWSTMLANQENLPQAVASLLPNIALTAYTFGNLQRTQRIAGFTEDQLFPGQSSPLGLQKYNTNNYTISLTQPVFNFTNWASVRQNQFVYKQATSTFCAAIQDLIIRVAQAYLNVLQAQDNLIYTEAQKLANYRQLDQTKQRYNVGLDAITSVYNAQAAYDSIVAQEIAARNTLHNNLEALRQLTGRYYPCIDGMKIPMPLINPCPEDVEKWVCSAERYNQTLMAARYGAEAARVAIKVFFGGHLPTLNAVTNYGRTSDQFQTFTLAQAGLQLNVPIFQGGFVASQVRQAQDNYATTVAEMVDAHRQITINARQSYNNVFSGISKVQADRAAILSAESSLQSTEESFRVGTRTIVDVLIVQQQLFQARTTYAADEYAYLLSTLQLKQAAGILSPCDLMQINSWLHGPMRRNMDLLKGPGIPGPIPQTGVTTPILDINPNQDITPTTGMSPGTTPPGDGSTNTTPNNGTPPLPPPTGPVTPTPVPNPNPIYPYPSNPGENPMIKRPIPMTKNQEQKPNKKPKAALAQKSSHKTDHKKHLAKADKSTKDLHKNA